MAKGMTKVTDNFAPKTREEIKYEDLWTPGVTTSEAMKLVAPDLVRFENQVREGISDEALANRRASIAQSREKGLGIDGTGVLHPVTVRRDLSAPVGSVRYVCVLGEIRTRAVQELEVERQAMEAAGKTDYFFHQPFLLPVVEMPTRDDQEILLLQLVENEQRNDLTPDEAGRAYLKLGRDGLTPAQIAHEVGLPQKTIEGRMGIAKAPSDVQAMAKERGDCVALVRVLKRLTTEKERRPFVRAALEKDGHGWRHGIQKLVRDVEQHARDLKAAADKAQREAERRAKQEKRASSDASNDASNGHGTPTRGLTLGLLPSAMPTNAPLRAAEPLQVSPVAIAPPAPSVWQEKRARAEKAASGIGARLALEVGRIKDVDILIGEIIQNALEMHDFDDLREPLAAIEKQVGIAGRHLKLIADKCARIRFNADIE